MNKVTKPRALRAAKDIKKFWKKSCLFIASPDGFYYDTVDDIIKHKGAIKPFKHKMINENTQKKYID